MRLSINNEKRERIDEMIDFRNIDVNVSNEIDEKINENVSDAFLDRFENVTNLNIENFDVVVVDEIIDEIVCEIVDEIVEILFFSLLKFRFETFLSIFFVV